MEFRSDTVLSPQLITPPFSVNKSIPRMTDMSFMGMINRSAKYTQSQMVMTCASFTWVTKIVPPADKTVIGVSNLEHLSPNCSTNSRARNDVVAPVSNNTLPGWVRMLSVPKTAWSDSPACSKVVQFSFPYGFPLLLLLLL